MNTARELNYRLYIYRDENFTRSDVRREFSVYDMIRNGETDLLKETLEERKANFLTGKGVLSENPLKNMMYHFIVSTAIISRVCLDGGMSHEDAYTLSDLYIRKADLISDPGKILDLLYEMQLDYALRMNSLSRKEHSYSPYVRHAIDYIYDHLHEKLTMEALAHNEDLNPSYFSTLFARDVGISVKKYILRARLTTGRNMLSNPDFSISDIAFSLRFSSQSAFTAAFKKEFSCTPAQYRKNYDYTKTI